MSNLLSSCHPVASWARSQSGLDTLAICARLGKSWVMKEWIHGDIWQGEGSPTLFTSPQHTLTHRVVPLCQRRAEPESSVVLLLRTGRRGNAARPAPAEPLLISAGVRWQLCDFFLLLSFDFKKKNVKRHQWTDDASFTHSRKVSRAYSAHVEWIDLSVRVREHEGPPTHTHTPHTHKYTGICFKHFSPLSFVWSPTWGSSWTRSFCLNWKKHWLIIFPPPNLNFVAELAEDWAALERWVHNQRNRETARVSNSHASSCGHSCVTLRPRDPQKHYLRFLPLLSFLSKPFFLLNTKLNAPPLICL